MQGQVEWPTFSCIHSYSIRLSDGNVASSCTKTACYKWTIMYVLLQCRFVFHVSILCYEVNIFFISLCSFYFIILIFLHIIRIALCCIYLHTPYLLHLYPCLHLPSFARHYHPSLTKSTTTKQHTVIKIPPSFIKVNGMDVYNALTDIFLYTFLGGKDRRYLCLTLIHRLFSLNIYHIYV